MPINSELTNTLIVTDNDKAKISNSSMLTYLGARQGSVIPFLPIRGAREKMLIHQKLNALTGREESLSNESVFNKLCIDWNTHYVSPDDKIYPKMPCHLIRYVKTWRKNQSRKDAAVASGSKALNDVLEYVPRGQPKIGTLEPMDFNNQTNSSTDMVPVRNEGLILLCSVCGSDQGVTPQNVQNEQHPKVRKKRRCLVEVDGRKCPDPYNCRGRNLRDNCILYTKGDPTKLKKRKIKSKYSKRCNMCGNHKCPGVSNRKRCKFVTEFAAV